MWHDRHSKNLGHYVIINFSKAGGGEQAKVLEGASAPPPNDAPGVDRAASAESGEVTPVRVAYVFLSHPCWCIDG